jgi:hypothetical protein
LEAPAPIYEKSVADADCCLVQGEILSNLVEVRINLASYKEPELRVDTTVHPLAIVLSQWCDLEQDYEARYRNPDAAKQNPTILFCQVCTATELKNRAPRSSNIWDRIKQNNDERYHFFQRVDSEFDAAGNGLEELGVDFKRFFAIPTDEAYYRIRESEAHRRCCLRSPYLEHFCRRFANFISRIALPEPHKSV